jgi:glycosyltransferase involved in cell wall biosynthesis
MRALIAAASFSPELSGIQRHAFNLTRCLLIHPAVSEVHLVVAPWQQELVRSAGLEAEARLHLHLAAMKPDAFSRNSWYYRRLPALAAKIEADVVHLAYPVPIDAAAFSCPTVVTLHDLYPYEIPSNFGFPKFLFNRFILQQCLRNVDSIVCVSDITYLLLGEYVPLNIRQKAVRIYNCVEPVSQCSVQSPISGWRGEPFLLCVAQHRRNKNIPLLLNIFQRLLHRQEIDSSTKLVIIGISGPETARMLRKIKRAGLTENVRLMEGLSEPDLQWCYRNCEVLLAPSKTEGFGLPVAEGLLAGCRVVCSNIPAFREIGGTSCRYVALDGPVKSAFAEAIVATLQEPRRRPIEMPLFSASVIASEYGRHYSSLLAPVQNSPRRMYSASVNGAKVERHSL